MSTYQSPRRGRWVPVTAGPDPLCCCVPSLPGSRVPPGCRWRRKTCGWGQRHNGPRLTPPRCRAPAERTRGNYSALSPAPGREKLSFLIAYSDVLPFWPELYIKKREKRGPPPHKVALFGGFSYRGVTWYGVRLWRGLTGPRSADWS